MGPVVLQADMLITANPIHHQDDIIRSFNGLLQADY